uniref:RHS repeat domain-containing protein n=2 Tax=Pseudomonas amygdali TaxID=47877 RepID=UPI0009BEA138
MLKSSCCPQINQGLQSVAGTKNRINQRLPKYSYDENGRLLSKVDAKGLVTTYEYNSRGLETKRIEAAGTSLQRITTTKWHSKFSLPVEVSGDGRTTEYGYDSEGRPISEGRAPIIEPVSPPPDSPITLPPRPN